MVQQRSPELCFLCIRIPGVDIFVHGFTEIRELGEIESVLDGPLKGFPGTAKVAVQITTGMAPHHGDAQTGNEFGQCAVAALFDGCLQVLKGLFTKARSLQKLVPVFLQLIQIAEVTDPAVTKELGQGGLGQALNVHSRFLTEVSELPNEFGCTVRVFAVHLSGAARSGPYDQFLTATGTNHRHFESAAPGVVLCNLRDNLVGLVDKNLVAHSKLERIEDVQIV